MKHSTCTAATPCTSHVHLHSLSLNCLYFIIVIIKRRLQVNSVGSWPAAYTCTHAPHRIKPEGAIATFNYRTLLALPPCSLYPWLYMFKELSLDITPYQPIATTPVLVLQLVGRHKALLTGNQWSPLPVVQLRWKSHRPLFCPDWDSSVWRTTINHQYANTDEPNQGETAVCGSSILVGWLGGGDHWLPVNRASCPPTNCNTNTGVVGRYGIISSDYSSIYCLCSGLLQLQATVPFHCTCTCSFAAQLDWWSCIYHNLQLQENVQCRPNIIIILHVFYDHRLCIIMYKHSSCS